jgi:hypothetical protein
MRPSSAGSWSLALVLLLVGCDQHEANSPTAELAAVPLVSASSAVEHSVTGSATVTEDGVAFRVSVAAHSDAEGQAWGRVEVPLDLSAFGLGITTFGGEVTCLDVDGDSAWIGARIDHSTDGGLVPPGLTTITLVRDLGGNGEDVMHAEPFDSGELCTDRPALLESLVDRGNFTVR